MTSLHFRSRRRSFGGLGALTEAIVEMEGICDTQSSLALTFFLSKSRRWYRLLCLLLPNSVCGGLLHGDFAYSDANLLASAAHRPSYSISVLALGAEKTYVNREDRMPAGVQSYSVPLLKPEAAQPYIEFLFPFSVTESFRRISTNRKRTNKSDVQAALSRLGTVEMRTAATEMTARTIDLQAQRVGSPWHRSFVSSTRFPISSSIGCTNDGSFGLSNSTV